MKGPVSVTSTLVGGPVILLNDLSPESKSLLGLAYYKWTHKPFSKSRLVERSVHTNTPGWVGGKTKNHLQRSRRVIDRDTAQSRSSVKIPSSWWGVVTFVSSRWGCSTYKFGHQWNRVNRGKWLHFTQQKGYLDDDHAACCLQSLTSLIPWLSLVSLFSICGYLLHHGSASVSLSSTSVTCLLIILH